MELRFERASLARDREVLTRFNIAYLNWSADAVQARFGLSLADVLGMPIPAYVAGALDKLCDGTPPAGVFYLVLDGDTAVGMGGLRQVGQYAGEVKRIYVSEAARGGGAGSMILERLMQDAREFGYRELVLDTGPFMTSAHRLYEAAGFFDIPPYAGVEVPEALHHDWRFMRCKLT